MKGLFILLLLINLGVFVWGIQRNPDFSPPQSVARSGVGNLRLLAELPVAENHEIGPGHSDTSVAREMPVDKPVQPVPGSDAAKDQPSIEEVGGVQGSDHVLSAEKEESVRGQTGIQDQSDDERVPEEKAEMPPGAVASCGAFGPFERGAVGREVIDLLKRRGFDASLRRDSLDKPVGYWVLIPPLADREAAVDKVNRLKESEITDIRRFVKGEQKNGISLGVFSSRENALKRQKEIASKGHSTQIVPRTITLPIYWVDYRADKTRIDRIEEELSIRYPEMKNEQYPCSRVVTPGGIF